MAVQLRILTKRAKDSKDSTVKDQAHTATLFHKNMLQVLSLLDSSLGRFSEQVAETQSESKTGSKKQVKALKKKVTELQKKLGLPIEHESNSTEEPGLERAFSTINMMDEASDDDDEFFDANDEWDGNGVLTQEAKRKRLENLGRSRMSSFVQMEKDKIAEPSVNKILSIVPKDFKPRTTLPSNSDFIGKVSIVKILREAIGKDLTKISIPVHFCEPTSLLQRLCEDCEYVNLLEKATKEKNSMKRLLYVLGFAVSSYASTNERLTKPFNSLLGETFDYVSPWDKFRVVAEQVSHHPPVTAFHADSADWTYFGHAGVDSKFWGRSMEVYPKNEITIILKNWEDEYCWNRVTTVINNLLFGSKWLDHYGKMKLKNNKTGDNVVLQFKKRGWSKSTYGVVSGTAYRGSDGEAIYKIDGYWQDKLTATPMDGSKPFVFYQKNPNPKDWAKYYHFSEFTFQLNELAKWMKPYIPDTDVRLRPDIRALDDGKIDLASSKKTELEEIQRARRKIREKNNIKHSPRWFKLNDSEDWVYKGGYWKSKFNKKWSNIIPIYEAPEDQ
mmetsp:Transcript_16113/g.17907  ORF Transcript_16113/g.17907 Transcript_16113/m.17907 type:complete len:557 (+) Transcript_16113:17-1687(+)